MTEFFLHRRAFLKTSLNSLMKAVGTILSIIVAGGLFHIGWNLVK